MSGMIRSQHPAKRSQIVGYLLSIFLISLLEYSCVAQRPGNPYYEDLSVYRPKFSNAIDTVKSTNGNNEVQPVVATKNVNAKIDMVLDSIDRFNLTKKFVDGFTIQIYSGQKRDEAMTAKQKMTTEVSDMTANLQYVQPKFRVTVGSYFNKLEAQKDLVRLKKHFSTAILVPEKIPIK